MAGGPPAVVDHWSKMSKRYINVRLPLPNNLQYEPNFICTRCNQGKVVFAVCHDHQEDKVTDRPICLWCWMVQYTQLQCPECRKRIRWARHSSTEKCECGARVSSSQRIWMPRPRQRKILRAYCSGSIEALSPEDRYPPTVEVVDERDTERFRGRLTIIRARDPDPLQDAPPPPEHESWWRDEHSPPRGGAVSPGYSPPSPSPQAQEWTDNRAPGNREGKDAWDDWDAYQPRGDRMGDVGF
eukprot:Hpha_TRINITY_DN15418_c1_g6::TRINITY_DN15418_c1_g6_i1::g.175052::m.175052